MPSAQLQRVDIVAKAVRFKQSHNLRARVPQRLVRQAVHEEDHKRLHVSSHHSTGWLALVDGEVRTIAVEEWLSELPLAPITRAKIRNVMSAVFSHCIRHEWITFNRLQRCECHPCGCGSRMFSLPKSSGHCFPAPIAGKVNGYDGRLDRASWFRNVCASFVGFCVCKRWRSRSRRLLFGNVKTAASKKPVPLHPEVCAALQEWRRHSIYRGDEEDHPASAERAGIFGKVIGWHSFRHTLATNSTNLRSLGVDVKVAQELLRHANSRITMDINTRAVSSEKRDASGRHAEMLLGNGGGFSALHRPAPSDDAGLTI